MKIGVVSLGCPKNLVDSELMLHILDSEGYEIVNDSSEAEIIIINTCGFIEDAKQESIDAILEMSALKSERCRKIIVTGCLCQRYSELLLKEMPEVDAILGVVEYPKITDVITMLLADDSRRINLVEAIGAKTQHDITYLEGGRVITTGPSYAYIKIAEGCDNHCSYCVIPSIRGGYASRKIENIVDEAARIADSGISEVVLVAQDSTHYGTDIYGKPMLGELLDRISRISGIKWIRTLYWYPDEIYEGLIEAVAGIDKVCKYIDIPLQHASDKILGLMHRRGSISSVETQIARLRSRINGLILRTSMIVGFPAETDEDFRDLLSFIKRVGFERLGAFIYSCEEGTAASRIKPKVNRDVAASRLEELMMTQQSISADYNRSRIGRIYTVKADMINEADKTVIGRTYAESPEIDGAVIFDYNYGTSAGGFVDVKITDADEYDLYGAAL